MDRHVLAARIAEERIASGDYDLDGRGTCEQCDRDDVPLHDASTCRECLAQNLADGIAMELQMGTPPKECGR